ncbi:MAG TPA: nitrile hydratase subunit beta [Mycobacteriales bacterium]|jgi:nitrile hydratase|nr:nitrile hydratase subunit beta [Mycobacteriales bacterium]
MDGVHDMGGRSELFGPLKPLVRDEPVFGEPWQGRAFALTLLANRAATSSNLHAFRHALERVPEKQYLADYYGRWLGSAEILLVDSGLLAPGAVEARAHRLQGADVQEPPDPEPHKPTMETAGGGNLRTVEAEPQFSVGDRVRAIGQASGHTRLTGYVRGRTGTVTALRPAQVLPDSAAHFLGEAPEHVYGVEFDSRELWGDGAETFSLTIDLFESYLEKA